MKLTFVLRNKKNALKVSTKNIENFVNRIKTDTKDRTVGRRREYIDLTGNAKSYDEQTPSHLIYPSAEFEKDTNDNLRMRTFNGVVALTVDGLLRPADIEAVKQAAQILHYTLAAFTGPTGREVIILVKIAKAGDTQAEELPDSQSEEEADTLCRQAYRLASALYQGILPATIHQEEGGLHSCFRMPLDPHPYFNAKAVALPVTSHPIPSTAAGRLLPAEPMSSQVPVNPHHIVGTDADLYLAYERMYLRAEEAAFEAVKNIPEQERHQAYLTELARQLCLMGLPEEEAALHIRQHHQFKPGYDEELMRTIVQTVFAENRRQDAATHDLPDTARETKRLMDFLNTRYMFRFNTIMGYTECRPNSTNYSEWQPVDDRTLKGLTMEVRLSDIDARDHDVRRYVHSNMIRPYNPIGEYLWNLYGKWDGKDHIRQLARTVPTRNPYWEDWFYTWFLGMVQQWQTSHLAKYGNQAVPLLISKQGWNKTTFCEQLLPPELRWGYTGNLQMDDKRQVLLQMAQMLLINLDEFNQISPHIQQGFLKNVITLSSVKIKRPYGRHVEDFPRRASFIATTNQADVLADPSGSRRFLGIELTGPIDVSTPPNYEQLYAQAMRALHKHEPYYFGQAEIQQIIDSNSQFSLKSAAEQFFTDYFEPADNEQEGEWVSASAIFNFLKDKVGVSLLRPANVSSFGRRLSSVPGLQKRVTRNNTEYLVKRKKT